MKRILALFLSLLMLVCVASWSVIPADASSKAKATEALDSTAFQASYTADIFSEEVLSGSTEKLITAILDSDIVISMLACNSTETTGYELLVDRNPALQELECRNDAASVLAEMIVSRASQLSCESVSMDDMCLAMLLSEPVYSSALTETEMTAVVAATQEIAVASVSEDVETMSTQETLWDLLVDWFTLNLNNYTAANPPVYTLDKSVADAYVAKLDYSSSVKESYQADVLAEFPSVTALDLPTKDYNCHSYAWHLSSTTNGYWIDNCSAYINDVHTQELKAPAVGAICVYYDSRGNAVHSALIISVTNGNVICRSKWGALGLYEHNRDYVPDTYKTSAKVTNCRYYAYPSSHTYSLLDSDSVGHSLRCTICSYQTTVQHAYRVVDYTSSGHTLICKTCNYDIDEPHIMNTATGKCTKCPYSGPTILLSITPELHTWDDAHGVTAACCDHA